MFSISIEVKHTKKLLKVKIPSFFLISFSFLFATLLIVEQKKYYGSEHTLFRLLIGVDCS